jgi:hypothetical protein
METGGKPTMLRHALCVIMLLLGPWTLLGPAPSRLLGAVIYSNHQNQSPEPADLPDTPSDMTPVAEPSTATDELMDEAPPGGCGCGGHCGMSAGPMCDSCDEGCGSAGPPRGFWGRAEAIGFFVRGSQAPPLLTTNTAGNVPTLGTAGTTILYPTNDLDRSARVGGRFTLGYWFDETETAGLQGNFFMLANQNHTANFNSGTGTTGILGRPFFNTGTGLEDSGLLGFPTGTQAAFGTASIHTSVRLLGAEANYRRALTRSRNSRIDFLAGYRFLRFDDSLSMGTSSTTLAGNSIGTGIVLATNDVFATQNQFHGGQVGLLWQGNQNRWGWDVTTKLAAGGLTQKLNVNGATTVLVPGSAPVTQTGGFLALGSNSGMYQRTVFSLIPELNTNLTYQLTPLWRLSVGYTLMYVTRVIRASDQIDHSINPSQFPPATAPAANPAHLMQQSDLWVQGVSVGAECRF